MPLMHKEGGQGDGRHTARQTPTERDRKTRGGKKTWLPDAAPLPGAMQVDDGTTVGGGERIPLVQTTCKTLSLEPLLCPL